jgi:hypothetical protein
MKTLKGIEIVCGGRDKRKNEKNIEKWSEIQYFYFKQK